jgi:hypothetical protein
MREDGKKDKHDEANSAFLVQEPEQIEDPKIDIYHL